MYGSLRTNSLTIHLFGLRLSSPCCKSLTGLWCRPSLIQCHVFQFTNYLSGELKTTLLDETGQWFTVISQSFTLKIVWHICPLPHLLCAITYLFCIEGVCRPLSLGHFTLHFLKFLYAACITHVLSSFISFIYCSYYKSTSSHLFQQVSCLYWFHVSSRCSISLKEQVTVYVTNLNHS